MKFIPLVFIFLLHNISYAQNNQFVDIKDEIMVTTEGGPTQAREEAIQLALEKVVKTYTVDIVGEKKYEESKGILKNQIINDSGKFAPVVKADAEAQKGNEYKVFVDIKISPQSLRQMLEKTGILTSKFDSGVVIPFVSFTDQIHARSYKWWINENLSDESLKDLNSSFVAELRKSLKDINFYVLNPVGWDFKNLLPLELQKDFYKKNDYEVMDSYFGIPLVIRGQVLVLSSKRVSSEYQAQIKLEVVLTSTGKIISESSNNMELGSSLSYQKEIFKAFQQVSEDLKNQLESALKRGVLESSMIQIALKGDLQYQNLEAFRNALLKFVPSIRYFVEKTIEKDYRVYEVDYSGSAQSLLKKLKSMKVQGVSTKEEKASASLIEIKLESI